MKYYAEFTTSTQPKNRKQAAAQDYAREVDGTLIMSDEALYSFVERFRDVISRINLKLKTGGDLCFLYQKHPDFHSEFIRVPDCLTIKFHQVKHEYPVITQSSDDFPPQKHM